MRRLAVAVSACLDTVTASAQEPDVLVKGGQPPAVGVVESVKGEVLMLRHYMVTPVQRTRKRPVISTVQVDGKVEKKTEYVEESYTQSTTKYTCVPHDLGGIRAFDLEGKPIPKERLATMFARPSMTLIAYPGIQVDPAFLKVAREGTVLIVLKQQPAAPVVKPE